ncbi:MAG: metallophosphoesterase [Anaerolineae bacterium]|nr:metallophosphoesterase [Anaerolineae bacterium]MCO5205057.1 metallophosphoesterase [Anaerolineae bacterium]
MKLLAVSDTVLPQLYNSEVRQRHPDIDLLIGCGDLPYYYLDFLISAMDVPLLYVLGNHDSDKQYTADRGMISGVQGGIDLHGRSVTIKGVIFAGLQGSMRYHPNKPLMYTETEMRYEVAQLVRRLWWNRLRYGHGLDVLVTHSPAYGIHDAEDLAHTGFKILLWLMRRFQPKYMLHGHLHRYRPNKRYITRYHDTTVINVYPRYILDLDADQPTAERSPIP